MCIVLPSDAPPCCHCSHTSSLKRRHGHMGTMALFPANASRHDAYTSTRQASLRQKYVLFHITSRLPSTSLTLVHLRKYGTPSSVHTPGSTGSVTPASRVSSSTSTVSPPAHSSSPNPTISPSRRPLRRTFLSLRTMIRR